MTDCPEVEKPQACLWCGLAKDDPRADEMGCYTSNGEHQFVPVTVF